jgi:molecular chaperone HtpG
MTAEKRELQTEVKQLLDLMVHSLYSNKDIFLRELISNASDALDKLRFEQLTNPELAPKDELEIRIDTQNEGDARTISVSDNGIGMSREEVIKNIGTIARSGTKEFLAAVKESKKSELPPELIGQFGVGFYASFMVANKVELLTRRAGELTATRWVSTGDGTYTIEEAERNIPGTTVTLHLLPADEENALRNYSDEAVVREIVKRYSDFVSYPVKDKKGQVLNSMKAIWTRAKSDVTEEEYREFYRHISHDWSEPLLHVPVKIEGNFEAHALLFVPSKAPFDLYNPEMRRGVQLYVKRVFIMEECKELMPSWLRFVRGVVDASDLSLNVSREILQKDRQIQVIKKQLVKKVLGALEDLKKTSFEKYLSFWSELGPVMKEGLVAQDANDKNRVMELMLASSTHEENKLTTLDDYVARMKEGQDAIYYLSGPNADTVRRSPLLETFRAKGYEVLLFSDPIDELWLERAPSFKDKALKAIGKGEVELGTEEEKKAAQTEKEEKERELKDLLTGLRAHLQDEVKEVRLSTRLTSSAVCLVGDEEDLSPSMQRILEQMGQPVTKTKRILELNPSHPVVGKLQSMWTENKADPRIKDYAELLFSQALLAEAGQLKDPAAFTRLVADLMVRAV